MHPNKHPALVLATAGPTMACNHAHCVCYDKDMYVHVVSLLYFVHGAHWQGPCTPRDSSLIAEPRWPPSERVSIPPREGEGPPRHSDGNEVRGWLGCTGWAWMYFRCIDHSLSGCSGAVQCVGMTQKVTELHNRCITGHVRSTQKYVPRNDAYFLVPEGGGTKLSPGSRFSVCVCFHVHGFSEEAA